MISILLALPAYFFVWAVLYTSCFVTFFIDVWIFTDLTKKCHFLAFQCQKVAFFESNLGQIDELYRIYRVAFGLCFDKTTILLSFRLSILFVVKILFFYIFLVFFWFFEKIMSVQACAAENSMKVPRILATALSDT